MRYSTDPQAAECYCAHEEDHLYPCADCSDVCAEDSEDNVLHIGQRVHIRILTVEGTALRPGRVVRVATHAEDFMTVLVDGVEVSTSAFYPYVYPCADNCTSLLHTL